MRRTILVLTTAAVLVAIIIATALPVFAGPGATQVTGFKCGVIDSNLNDVETTNSKNTATPSGNINTHCHYHPDTNL
jgi:hypothetical protein